MSKRTCYRFTSEVGPFTLACGLAVLAGCPGQDPGGAAVSELGLSERIAKAPEPNSAACTRLKALAIQVQDRLSQGDRNLPDLGSRVRAAVQKGASSFGAFDGLVFGEVHRGFSSYMSDGETSATEHSILVASLQQHLRLGGMDAEVHQGIVQALSGPPGMGPLGIVDTTLRNLHAQLIVDVANLFSDLQQCAPR